MNQGEKGVVLYNIDEDKTGARINMVDKKAYYYTGANKSADTLKDSPELEIATKADIAAAAVGTEGAGAIKVSSAPEKNTISLALDTNHNGSGITGNTGSGLTQSDDGLAIDDSLTWVFNCGSASEFVNTQSQE